MLLMIYKKGKIQKFRKGGFFKYKFNIFFFQYFKENTKFSRFKGVNLSKTFVLRSLCWLRDDLRFKPNGMKDLAACFRCAPLYPLLGCMSVSLYRFISNILNSFYLFTHFREFLSFASLFSPFFLLCHFPAFPIFFFSKQ